MKSYAAGFLLAVTVLQNPCCVQAQPLPAPTIAPVTASVAADGVRSRAKQKPRFTIPLGKGWSVCESYARFLNAQPEDEPLPLCHLKLGSAISDLIEPNWDEIDIASHLELVHAIENPSYPSYLRKTPFDEWRTEFERGLKSGRSPRLRRTRLALIDGGPVETILAYEADRNACDNMVRQIGFAFEGEGARLLLWNEREQKVEDFKSSVTFGLSGRLLLSKGKPLLLVTHWGSSQDLPSSTISVAGRIHIRHFVTPDNIGSYSNLERCTIRYELPPQVLQRMSSPETVETFKRMTK